MGFSVSPLLSRDSEIIVPLVSRRAATADFAESHRRHAAFSRGSLAVVERHKAFANISRQVTDGT
jgi:hypothetical protein